MRKLVSKSVKGCLLAGAMFVSSVQAHPLWILPSEYSLSTEKEAGEWVTFDVSASHTVFGFDKPVPLDNMAIFSPDGDRNPIGSYFKGHRRSVFDHYFDQSGTYKVQGKRPQFYFTSYKSGKRDTPKRMMADKVKAKERLPKNARDIETWLIDATSVAYITNNQPTDLVTEVKGKGLEIKLDTHPSDLVQGEEAEFSMLLNGKPVAGVEIEITPSGTKYRDDRGSIKLKTEADGSVAFTPELAGPWFFTASLEAKTDSLLADYNLSIRYLTFEVLPE